MAAKIRADREEAHAPDGRRAMDFVHDQLVKGPWFKILKVVDIYSKVYPVIAVGMGYRGHEIVATLEKATKQYGKPTNIRID